ncbi:MAG: hypothetical protein ACW99A_21970 [Candidatus Kariarchaeaceae archaeon]|jgi:hypothetical protein
MPSNNPYTLRGVEHYGEDGFRSSLEVNIKHYLDWAFLKIGAWENIDIPTSGAYGGVFHQLRSASDISYTSGQVWEGVRKDWVFETGINYIDITGGIHNPNIPSVFVGGTGILVDTTGYEHHIDYPLGRVIFDSTIPTGSDVTASYAFRNVQIYRSDDAPWLMELQQDSLRPDRINWSDFYHSDTGEWAVGPHQRIQLPAIVIESAAGRRSEPYEIGNTTQWVDQDVLFHVISENKFERNNLIDLLANQIDNTLYLYKPYEVAASGFFPLDFRGMIVDNPKMYPSIVDQSLWKKCWITESSVSNVDTRSPFLHMGIVRLAFQIIL